MSKSKYSLSFSLGNVVTIVSSVALAFSVIGALQVAVASANQERKDMKGQIDKNELAIHQVVRLREDIIRVQVNQENQTKQINRILAYLEENNRRLGGE